MPRYKIDPYLFGEKEEIVLKSAEDYDTPLKISLDTNIPRSTVYILLGRLKKRGLIVEFTVGKKKRWRLTNVELKNVKKNLKSYPKYMKVYKSKFEVDRFLKQLVNDSKSKFTALNGDQNPEGWRKNVGPEKVAEYNKLLGKNRVISDIMASKVFYKENMDKLGEEWIDHFKNKPAEYHLLDDKYTNFKPQIVIKKNQVLLVDMSKPIVIEINDSDFYSCFESIFDFIKDNSKKIQINDVI